MSSTGFDDSNIIWNQLEGIDHVWYHVCDVDEDAKIVDVLLKFSANQKIVLHRHHADYRTFVLQGELRIYAPDGSVKEVRPTGSYIFTKGGGEPHTEGGGDVDVVVLFSNRGTDGTIYEILDDQLNTLATLGLRDFRHLLDAQTPSPAHRVPARA